MPIVRVQLESLKMTMLHAFHETQLRMDEMVKQSIESACHPDRLKEIMETAAKQAIDGAIQQEIRDFYTYGTGRKAIAKLVQEKLSEELV